MKKRTVIYHTEVSPLMNALKGHMLEAKDDPGKYHRTWVRRGQ